MCVEQMCNVCLSAKNINIEYSIDIICVYRYWYCW